MHGVLFGVYHSYRDFGLIINSKKIGKPPIKKKTIDIEGADGVLDYSDFFGVVTYGNRPLEFRFQLNVEPSKYLDAYSTILNALNGQKHRIVLDDDPDFYYLGRIEVSDLITEKNQAFIDITCDCEPYKYKANVTVVSIDVVEGEITKLQNLKKRVVPTITTDSTFNIGWNNFSTTVSAGTFIVPELELVEGENEIRISGTGNIKFEYQEGGL